MPINRAAAKAAGYSDEEINAFEAEEKRKGPPQVPQTVSNEPPPPDQVTAPIPEVSSTNQWMGIIGAGAGDITGKVKDIAIPLGEGYLAYKGLQAWREHSAAGQARAAADQARALAEAAAESGRQARWEARNPLPPQPAPSARPGAQAFSQMGQQLTHPPVGPVAPAAPAPMAGPAANAMQGAAQATQGENWIARAMEMAKQVGPALEQYTSRAASALAPVGRAIAPVARVAGSAPVMGAQLMLTPSDLGPKVPRSGPLRGSEINPQTGRGWTDAELAQYNSVYR